MPKGAWNLMLASWQDDIPMFSWTALERTKIKAAQRRTLDAGELIVARNECLATINSNATSVRILPGGLPRCKSWSPVLISVYRMTTPTSNRHFIRINTKAARYY
jgi:hypothetical protein